MRWVITGQFKDGDLVTIPPFEALSLALGNLRVPEPVETDGGQSEAD